jgi:hypothetical protein
MLAFLDSLKELNNSLKNDNNQSEPFQPCEYHSSASLLVSKFD